MAKQHTVKFPAVAIITVFSITFLERLWQGYLKELVHADDFEDERAGKKQVRLH